MDKQQKVNRLTILLIFALSLVPFAIAWYLAKHPETVKLGKSNGELIDPPQITQETDFVGIDNFSAANMFEIKGHWVMIVPIGQACQKDCQEALFKARQLNLMMGKEITRIRRLALRSFDSATLPEEWQNDARLLKASPSTALQQIINKITGNNLAEGMLLIMDPLGNVMMKYSPGFDAYKVRDDLTKLLKISQIG